MRGRFQVFAYFLTALLSRSMVTCASEGRWKESQQDGQLVFARELTEKLQGAFSTSPALQQVKSLGQLLAAAMIYQGVAESADVAMDRSAALTSGLRNPVSEDDFFGLLAQVGPAVADELLVVLGNVGVQSRSDL